MYGWNQHDASMGLVSFWRGICRVNHWFNLCFAASGCWQTDKSSINKHVAMKIRQTTQADLDDILSVERAAFNRDSEVNLTRALLADPSAEPRLSLMAYVDDQPVGHILFTKGILTNHPDVALSFLAPLAVIPKFQRQGIGGALIRRSLELLAEAYGDLIVVLGHPAYYPKFGFKPALELGFEPTYPIPAKVADAWMVQALKPNIIGRVSGRVICCDAMNKPEIWRE